MKVGAKLQMKKECWQNGKELGALWRFCIKIYAFVYKNKKKEYGNISNILIIN